MKKGVLKTDGVLCLQNVKVIVRTLTYGGYWGKGDTVEEALKNAKYIKGTEPYSVHLAHPDTTCGSDGGFCFPEGFPPKEIFTGRVVKPKKEKAGK